MTKREKVGVGTTTPQSSIEVVGAGDTSSTSSLKVSNSAGRASIDVQDNGDIKIGNDQILTHLRFGEGTGYLKTSASGTHGTIGNMDLFNCGLVNAFQANGQDVTKINNLGVNTFQFGSSAAGVIGIGAGTAPTSDNPNVVQVYSTDGSDLNFRNENGTIVDIFSLGGGALSWTETSGNVYRNSGNVGIGVSSPSTKLHISHNGAQQIRVDDGTNNLDIGILNGDVNLGYSNIHSNISIAKNPTIDSGVTQAIGFGENIDLKGDFAIAIGAAAKANTANAIALGQGTISKGIAIGPGSSTGEANTSICIGTNGALANSNYSVSIGYDAKNNAAGSAGNYSIALGTSTRNASDGNVAIGVSATNEKSHGVAIGWEAYSNAVAGLAIGSKAKVGTSSSTFNNGAAIGRYTLSNAEGAMVLGYGVTDGSPLTNSVTNSVAIGAYSDTPTMTVTGGNGSAGSTGSVGIGTTTPSTELDVKGTVTLEDVIIAKDHGSGTPTGTGAQGEIRRYQEDLFIYLGTAWKKFSLQ